MLGGIASIVTHQTQVQADLLTYRAQEENDFSANYDEKCILQEV